MLSFDTILKSIKTKCLLNEGAAFDMKDFFSFGYYKQYRGKKILFMCRWVYERTERICGYEETKKILLKLPKGISFTINDVVFGKLPDQVTPNYTEYEHHKITITIHVSESYSQKIVKQNKGHKIVCIGNFDSSTMRSALKFKKTIMTSHREILDPLFKNGFLQSFSLTNNGFTDYDCHSYRLEDVNMKPLQNESQCLGLALALAEYGEKYIPDNEIFFIDNNGFNNDIDITRGQIEKATNLNDW